MVKSKTIDSFFKRKNVEDVDIETTIQEQRPSKVLRVSAQSMDILSLERDPGLRPHIWDFPSNSRDDFRRAYINAGPYQIVLPDYPLSGNDTHPRRFQSSWFKKFPWLEYSPAADAAYCLPCYVFSKQGTGRPGSNAFTSEGFRNWKKVNDGKKCAFLNHMGNDPCSFHNNAVKYCDSLMDQASHFDKRVEKHSSIQIAKNRLRLQTSIDCVRWLSYQGCAFRGHDESPESMNRGNFLEMIKILAKYNEKVAEVVLENAPKNAKYTSPTIQKELLHILSSRVRRKIREDIGDTKFCIIVDESRDGSKREQMAIVIRFVDQEGFVRERFFDLVHVKDTTSLTLKKEISAVLSRNCLSNQDIRGQGYDGASNMRGEWNGLQALFLNDCPYAYYVHCMAHRLQLALVAASREVVNVHQFFNKLTFIINIVGASCRRTDELREAQANEIANLIAIDELETGRGANQIGTLQRAGDTRWSSHFNSICSLIKMFGSTMSVLKNLIENGSTYAIRGDADAAYDTITSFEFVFVLHVMKEIMGTIDILCQALQQENQDISNAMHLVLTTKRLLQKLRDDGWSKLIGEVRSFCERQGVEIPDMSTEYKKGRGRSRNQVDHITLEHHYRIDIFVAAVDSQMLELDNRFNERVTELLTLVSCLEPRGGYRSFKVDDIVTLANKFYPGDFTEQEKIHLEYQLRHYEVDVPHHPDLKDLSTTSELCRALVVTGKSETYHLIHRLICLVLTPPVSTATTERAFSAMKIVKTSLRNKMEDEFLADCLLIYIEKEVAENFDSDMIIDEFYSLKNRRVPL